MNRSEMYILKFMLYVMLCLIFFFGFTSYVCLCCPRLNVYIEELKLPTCGKQEAVGGKITVSMYHMYYVLFAECAAGRK